MQHGGAPSTKYDRDRSELLRDEAEIQLELRHVHAAARVAVCGAEAESAGAEAAVAATMVAHWGQDFVALAGRYDGYRCNRLQPTAVTAYRCDSLQLAALQPV